MICNKCGTEIKEDSFHCDNCGTLNLPEFKKSAVTYDYRTKETNDRNMNEVIDCYEALGWILADKKESYLSSNITLNFRRDRKIKNKESLNRLQVKIDDFLNGISILEKRKRQNAVVISLILGIIGTLFFGMGMCFCMPDVFKATPDFWMYLTGGVFSVIGIFLGGIAYMAYKKIKDKQTVKMDIVIEKKRDEISNACQDAQNLLA